MCLIIFSVKDHPKYKLVVAGNRDEFYKRPTEPASFWNDGSGILGGKDLTAGGTWMGVTKTGKISMITNYRDLSNLKKDAPSRGHLVSDFLKNGDDGKTYLEGIKRIGSDYNGYNLIAGTIDGLFYQSNYDEKGVRAITQGIHGLSNHLLNTPWPKLEAARDRIQNLLKDDPEPESVFQAMYDSERFPEEKLPDTGVGKEMEKMLSPIFIKSPEYGSRTTTYIRVDWDNNLEFFERSYNTDDYSFVDRDYRIKVD